MNPILSIHTWCALPTEVRYRIRRLFSIPCSSNTVVNDGRIETDGTTPEDFKHLTAAKMQEYLGTDMSDFHRLFDMVVSKVTEELNPNKAKQEEAKVEAPAKAKKTKKNAHEAEANK